MNRVLPILFNTNMVRAILDGRKTVTRRVIKPQPVEGHFSFVYQSNNAHIRTEDGDIKSPYQPGDILYVRETWQYAYELDGNDNIIEETGRYLYAADDYPTFNDWVMEDGTHRNHMPWKPSIHMPKEAARIWLKVTDVRVERLQDITEEQAQKEGCSAGHYEYKGSIFGEEYYDEWTAIDDFKNVWNSTIKKTNIETYCWDANPWVWVIEFERCEKPELLEGGAE